MPENTIPVWIPPVTPAPVLNEQTPLNETLLTWLAEGAPIPIILGEAQVGGKVFAVDYESPVESPETGRWTVGVIWCIGEVDSIQNTYINGAAPVGGVTQNNYVGAITSPHVVDSLLSGAIGGYADPMVFDTPQGEVGVCYSVFQYTDNDYTDSPQFVAKIRGMLVDDTGSPSPVYSNNPAKCLRWLIKDAVHGLGETIDEASFITAASNNDATVITEARRTLGLVIDKAMTTMDWVEVLAGYASCWVYKDGSTWYAISDRPRTADESINKSRIKQDSLSVDIADRDRQPTQVEVVYADTTETIWRENIAVAFLTGVDTGATPRRVSRVSLPGINRYSQAKREAEERLNKLQQFKTVRYIGFDEEQVRALGDVIEVSHDIGLVDEAFRVNAPPVDRYGRVTVQAISYSALDYDNTEATAPTFGSNSGYVGGGSSGASGTNGQPGAPGLPGAAGILYYDDLDTTGQATGDGGYAILTDGTNNSSGGDDNNDFETGTGMGLIINDNDKNGTSQATYLNSLIADDTIVFWVSSSRWYHYLITSVETALTSPARHKFKMDFIASDTRGGTGVISGTPGTNVQWRGSRGGAGADGTDGNTVRSGIGAPGAGLGNEGDFYIDTDADTIYGPKAGSPAVWGSGTPLRGADGSDGFIPGVNWGVGSMTVLLTRNQESNGTTNYGEIRVEAGGFTWPDGTTRSIASDTQVNTPFESGERPSTMNAGAQSTDDIFYIIWGATNANTRFSASTFGNTDGLFAAAYKKTTGVWTALGNLTSETESFEPLDTDVIIATGYVANTSPEQLGITFVSPQTPSLPSNIVEWYFQTGQPTNANEGDYWIDTDDGNTLKRFNTSTSPGTWDDVSDTAIVTAINNAATAQSTADGKIVTFAQTSAPTAEGVGDIWMDTNDNNKIYRWSGSAWVEYIQDEADWAKVFGDNRPADSATVGAQAGVNLFTEASDLLADIDIRNDQLVGTALGGSLLGNPSLDATRFNSDKTGLKPAGIFIRGNAETEVSYSSGDRDTVDFDQNGGGTSLYAVWAAIAINDATEYELTVVARSDHNNSIGFGMTENTLSPASGVSAILHLGAGTFTDSQIQTSTGTLKNIASPTLTGTMTRYTYTYAPTAGTKFASFWVALATSEHIEIDSLWLRSKSTRNTGAMADEDEVTAPFVQTGSLYRVSKGGGYESGLTSFKGPSTWVEVVTCDLVVPATITNIRVRAQFNGIVAMGYTTGSTSITGWGIQWRILDHDDVVIEQGIWEVSGIPSPTTAPTQKLGYGAHNFDVIFDNTYLNASTTNTFKVELYTANTLTTAWSKYENFTLVMYDAAGDDS